MIETLNAEFIYRAGDFINITGRKNHKWKHRVSELENECVVSKYDKDITKASSIIESVDKSWEKGRGQSVGYFRKVVQAFSDYAKVSDCLGYTISRENASIAYGISQKITQQWVGLLVGIHSFTDAITDAGRAQHLLETRYWCEAINEDALLNSGSATGIRGLDATKRKLRPVCVQQIYALKPQTEPTLEYYHNSKQKPQVVKTGFGLG